MHVLFITPYPPSRIRARPFGLVQGLANLGHAVTVMALASRREAADISQVRPFCQAAHVILHSRAELVWHLAQSALTGRPLQAAYGQSVAMQKAIREAVHPDRFDVVHVEHLRASLLGSAVEGLPRVYDSVDCISLLLRRAREANPQLLTRLVATLELGRTERYEGRVGEGYDAVLITSPEDKAALEALARRFTGQKTVRPVYVVPNGVDLQYFAPTDGDRQPDVLVYTGKMSYHANVASALLLARAVMPLVWQERPQVKLWIVGKDPPRALTDLGRDSRITVTGYVPDMRPYLAQATVAVAPIAYGVGIQNKVLEAMAMGVPVVTSGRVQGALHVDAGEALVVADDPQEFARRVLEVLSNGQRQQELGEAGRRYVEAHHDWRVIAEDLVGIYRGISADH